VELPGFFVLRAPRSKEVCQSNDRFGALGDAPRYLLVTEMLDKPMIWLIAYQISLENLVDLVGSVALHAPQQVAVDVKSKRD
jgi:hypothetical protein